MTKIYAEHWPNSTGLYLPPTHTPLVEGSSYQLPQYGGDKPLSQTAEVEPFSCGYRNVASELR